MWLVVTKSFEFFLGHYSDLFIRDNTMCFSMRYVKRRHIYSKITSKGNTFIYNQT